MSRQKISSLFRIFPFSASVIGVVVALSVALWATNASAYESYHDPALEGEPDEGYCWTCHPTFSGRGDLHDLHQGGSDPVTGNCNLCHTGSGRDNPLTMWSTGDAGDGLGCAGCHGRDYGDNIEANYRGFGISGMAKNSAYGLRLHHANSGIAVCATCHDDGATNPPTVDDGTPSPENVLYPMGAPPASVQHYYDRAWQPGEQRATRLVVIGETGLDEQAVRAALGD